MKLLRLVPVSLADLSPPDLDLALRIAKARVRVRTLSLRDAVDWMEQVYGEQEQRQAAVAPSGEATAVSSAGNSTSQPQSSARASAARSSSVGSA